MALVDRPELGHDFRGHAIGLCFNHRERLVSQCGNSPAAALPQYGVLAAQPIQIGVQRPQVGHVNQGGQGRRPHLGISMGRQQGLDRRRVVEFTQGRHGGPADFGVGVLGQRQEGRPARFAADAHQCLQGGPPDLRVVGASVGDEARCGGRTPEAAQSPDRRGQQSGLRQAGRQQVLQGSRHFPTTDALGGGDSRRKRGSVALGRSQDLGDQATGLPIV